MKRVFLALFLLARPASDVFAQPPPGEPVPSEARPTTRFDLFGGLTLVRMRPGTDTERTGLAGWQASATFYPFPGQGFRSRFGVAAEFVRARRTPALDEVQVPGTEVRITENTFLSGVAIRMIRGERVSSNMRVLVGVASVSTAIPRPLDQTGIGPGLTPRNIGVFEDETTFAMAFGGAWEIRVAPRVAVRVHPTALITRLGGETQLSPRLTTGMVFRWQRDKER